jgi:hypothetical protein
MDCAIPGVSWMGLQMVRGRDHGAEAPKIWVRDVKGGDAAKNEFARGNGRTRGVGGLARAAPPPGRTWPPRTPEPAPGRLPLTQSPLRGGAYLSA